MFIHLKKNCKKFANALRLRKDTFKLKILDNCGFLHKQLLFLYYCPKIPLNAIVLHGREFDYNDNISLNSSTKKVVISRSQFSLELKIHQHILVSARMCQERIFSLMSVESPRSEIGHLPRYNMTSPVDILYNVDIQIS